MIVLQHPVIKQTYRYTELNDIHNFTFTNTQHKPNVETEVFTIFDIVAMGGIRFTQNGEVSHNPIVAILFKEALYFPIAEQVGV